MKLWGGRFDQEPDELMRRFGDSLVFDRLLYDADIRGSVAYARALQKAGILSVEERDTIIQGLLQVKAEFDADQFQAAPGDEDIHTAVERRLTELIGPAAGKLHTGRSRNDQVALDLRLWILDAVGRIQNDLAGLQASLLRVAEDHLGLVMPGYTHLQPAQPVLFSHWLMSYFWMFARDQERLQDCARRTAVSPLGSGALAGNPFPIDREAIAADLGMQTASRNSLDAVGDRDFVLEFLFAAAMIGLHISRLSEDLILYSGPGYGFVKIGEAYTTGSSLMPQKRNPDSLELARGKSGRLIGALTGMLIVLKGMPSTYNKDLQEDKEPVFDATQTLGLVLPVIRGVIGSLQPDGERMQSALDTAMLATDLADYLVERGVPFREAHHLVGELVKYAEKQGEPLEALSPDRYQSISPLFAPDVKEAFDFDRSVSRRAAVGGTAQTAVIRQIAEAKELLARS